MIRPESKGKLNFKRFIVPYRLYGKNGPFIVCVNGAQQSMAAWQSTVARFSENYRMVIYDSPGQVPNTILSGPATLTMQEQIGVLAEVIHRLTDRESPLYLVGASWGSVIAAIYAAKYPAGIDRLILGSFSLRPSQAMLRIIDKARKLYETRTGSQGAQLIIESFGQRLPEEYKQRMMKQFENLPHEHLEGFYHHLQIIARSGAVHDYVDLSKIRASTLLINGEDDQLLDNRDLKIAAQLIPESEIRLVPEAGHFLHLENEAIFDIYSEYLSRAGYSVPAQSEAYLRIA